MGRLVCFCLALALALCAVSTRGRAAEDKTPDKARHDARLDQRVSVATAYDSLEEFCAKLGRMTEGPAQQAADQTSVGATSSLGIPHDKPEVANQTTPAAPSLVGQPSRLSGFGGGNGRPQGVAPTGEASPSTSAPVDISCDPAIKDHKVVVRVKEQPLRELMRQIAVLFDFTWMQGPQEHPRYHLIQSTARAKLANDLRKRYLDEKDAHYRRVFKDAVRASKASPDQLRELAKTDPDSVTLAVYYSESWALCGALDDETTEAVLDGQVVTIPFTALPLEMQARVQERWAQSQDAPDGSETPATPAPVWQWDSAALRYQRDDRLSPWAVEVQLRVGVAGFPADSGIFWNGLARLRPVTLWSQMAANLAFNEDRQTSGESEGYERLLALEREYGIDVVGRARGESKDQVPAWARPQPDVEPQPSGRVVPVKGIRSYSRPNRAVPELPEFLLNVAEALDINLIADCYWTHRETGRTTPKRDSRYAPFYPSVTDAQGQFCVDADAAYTISRICNDRGCIWSEDGGFFRVRNALWFVDDPDEVPASVLNEWMRRTHDERRVTVADYLFLVGNLSAHLAEGIASTRYKGTHWYLEKATSVSWAYYPLKLYSLLPSGLQDRANTAGLSFSDIPQDLWPIVQDMFDRRTLASTGLPEVLQAAEGGGRAENLRLWAGHRRQAVPPDDVGGRRGVYRSCFCLEFWHAGQPDWTAEVNDRAPDRVAACNYWLADEPPKPNRGAQERPSGTADGAAKNGKAQ